MAHGPSVTADRIYLHCDGSILLGASIQFQLNTEAGVITECADLLPNELAALVIMLGKARRRLSDRARPVGA